VDGQKRPECGNSFSEGAFQKGGFGKSIGAQCKHYHPERHSGIGCGLIFKDYQ
jgi:hypothetical protein